MEIASVNKFYNLTVEQDVVLKTVREDYQSLTHHASECLACGACETRYLFGVKIIKSIHSAMKRFRY